jgi:hypothetical protein
MTTSRRNFIKIGSISAALIAGNCLGLENKIFGQSNILRGGGKLPPEVYGDPLFLYRADTFGKFIGSPFNLFTEEFAAAAVLVRVEKTESAKGGKVKSAENFILSFRVSSAEAKQATYTVIHGELGQFDLLLVPAINEKGENLLNAVINRL